MDTKKSLSFKFFHKKVLTPFIALIIVICCVSLSITASLICQKKHEIEPLTLEQLYQAAVLDAVTIENDEIFPLVTIAEGGDSITWKDGKVLLLTYNRHPDRYISGSTITLQGEVWTVADKELYSWYKNNKNGVEDWSMRFKQLVGVPPDGVYTHMTAMWVNPKDILRPAYLTDITKTEMQTQLPDDTDENYITWFNGNIIWSYFNSAYPWTRLGYTYDWAENSCEYGLTEFWVSPYSEVEIEFTDTVEEFLARLEVI